MLTFTSVWQSPVLVLTQPSAAQMQLGLRIWARVHGAGKSASFWWHSLGLVFPLIFARRGSTRDRGECGSFSLVLFIDRIRVSFSSVSGRFIAGATEFLRVHASRERNRGPVGKICLHGWAILRCSCKNSFSSLFFVVVWIASAGNLMRIFS